MEKHKSQRKSQRFDYIQTKMSAYFKYYKLNWKAKDTLGKKEISGGKLITASENGQLKTTGLIEQSQRVRANVQ